MKQEDLGILEEENKIKHKRCVCVCVSVCVCVCVWNSCDVKGGEG